MKFGVDYYPEHISRSYWEWDAEKMQEAGIEVVRMAEFAWAKMEPAEGQYDFGWLDEAIVILGRRGIKTVLGTPTATPPVWIIERNPEILPVNLQGQRLGFGGRHHNCQSNETYRDHIRRFVREMAKHYNNNPHVIGWQTDNEFGNSHLQLCACDSCRSRFHQWLERKYGTIDALNDAWGTVFWSQTYSRFEQIPAPLPTPNSHNPSLLLDWRRFCSDLIVDFQKVQIDILRQECPNQFITHNFMGFFDKTDYFDLAKDLDFVSHDQYPMHFRDMRIPMTTPSHLSMALDLMRGTKQQSFWIMEQLAGPTGWELISSTPRPGQIRMWTYHSIAHGADTIVYFRWDTCLAGTEQYWHGILPHSRIPGRRFAEVKQTIQELSPYMEYFRGGSPKAEAGILFSYDQEWALQIQPHHPGLNYIELLRSYYKGFYDANVPVDIVSDKEDYSRYKVLVAPLLFLTHPDTCQKLYEYVSAGGHLVLSMRTGVKDWNNAVVPKMLPGEFSDLLGIAIEDYDCLRQFGQGLKWTKGAANIEEDVKLWSDIITLKGAESLAEYNRDFYANTPGITRNVYNKGRAYYVGSDLGPEMMARFIGEVSTASGVKGLMESPENVEVTRRCGHDGDYMFVINHNSEDASVKLQEAWEVLVGKEFVHGSVLTLAPYGVALIRRAYESEWKTEG
ncbi:beta-galactosidase [Paenibacillus piri]|uniref:Beta-galactosidase n=1 Tax=Paenibacillus piri TaxID=2547395 RepID=A0A4R5KIT3_9BACL|nr:beta-galactosidase [Paenibacillus piri]